MSSSARNIDGIRTSKRLKRGATDPVAEKNARDEKRGGLLWKELVRRRLASGVLKADNAGEGYKFSIVGYQAGESKQTKMPALWLSYAELWCASASDEADEEESQDCELPPAELTELHVVVKRSDNLIGKARREQQRHGLSVSPQPTQTPVNNTPTSNDPPTAVSPEGESGANDVETDSYASMARDIANTARERSEREKSALRLEIEELRKKLSEEIQARHTATDRVKDLLAENEGLIADNDGLRAFKEDCNKLSDENNELTIKTSKLQRTVDKMRAVFADTDDS